MLRRRAVVLAAVLCFCVGLFSSVGVTQAQQNNPYQALSYLQDWSAFFETTFMAHNTDDQGRLAAGGDVTLENYEVGTLLNASSCTRVDLLVGGNLWFANGAVPNGEILVTGTNSLNAVSTECNAAQGTSPIDFDTAFSDLIGVSQALSQLAANGVVDGEGTDTLTLTGTAVAPQKNVFAVSGASLKGVTTININLPGGAFGIINVDGTDNVFEGLQINLSPDTSYRYILWNFFETKQLSLSAISVAGSLLAPAAEIEFTNGNVQGSICGYSYNGTGEIHLFPILPFCPSCDPCTHTISLPGWSIFVLNNVNLSATDDRGNFAAGGNVWLSHYEIGADYPAAPPIADVVVGGDFYLSSGQIVNGNALVGGTATLVNAGVVSPGTLTQNTPVPIDFKSSFAVLTNLSLALSEVPANGQISSGYGGAIAAIGSEVGLNVFNIPSTLLATVTQLNVSVPFASWVLFNIDGSGDTFTNLQINLNGINATNVLFNFYQATSLTITGVKIEGSILAPGADLNFTNGAIDGSLYVSNLIGDGEVHYFPYVPYGNNCPPCPPCTS